MLCLDTLRKGKEAAVPVYDFTRHARSQEVISVQPVEVILFEGILVLHVPQILERLNMKVRHACPLVALEASHASQPSREHSTVYRFRNDLIVGYSG